MPDFKDQPENPTDKNSIPKIDMFKLDPGVNPLASNPKFQKWKEKCIKEQEEKK